jgi:hypothetical protein
MRSAAGWNRCIWSSAEAGIEIVLREHPAARLDARHVPAVVPDLAGVPDGAVLKAVGT